MYLGPFLPDDDVTGPHLLAPKPLYAISLAGAVPSVSGTAASLFM
jgi:hypothetical protein